MIRQLRKQFILVAMLSVFSVLAVIVGSLNAAAFGNVISRADGILELLSENDGHFPDNFPGPVKPVFEDTFGSREMEKPWDWKFFREPERGFGWSPETPYDTRFFSVRLNEEGEIVAVDTGRIAAVETEGAAAYATQVWTEGKKKGFLESYRFLRQDVAGSRDCRIIFVDCGQELDACRSLAFTSLVVSLLGMLAVFVLVLFFSRKVFAPVEQSYIRQKRFVTDASHELKTPLTIISANVDILELEGQENQWTASIRKQVKRLGSLTEQMVTLSRLDEEEKLVCTLCSLSELAEETAAVFAPLAQARGKKLTAEIAPNLTCKGDEEKLRQMLSLLLDNALKYASEQGEIRLKLAPAKKGGRVCLTVWNTVDRQQGMEPGSQNLLFERFYRPDASRCSRTGGSGIGLSIVKAIVEQHHGRITAGSDDGTSILFTIYL